MQPAFRRKITRNSFIENRLFEKIAVTKCESQYQGCLPFADRTQDLVGHARISAFHKGKPAWGKPFVGSYGIFRKQFEIASITATGFARGVPLIQNDDCFLAVAQAVGRSSACQACADDDYVGRGGENAG